MTKPAETDRPRLLRAIAGLHAPLASQPPGGRPIYSGSAGDPLEALRREIDTTVLPRQLRFSSTTAGCLVLWVVERRVVAAASGETARISRADFADVQGVVTDPADIRPMVCAFARSGGEIRITPVIVSGGFLGSMTGCSGAELAAPEEMPPAGSLFEWVRVLSGDLPLAMVGFSPGQAPQSSGDTSWIEKLMPLAEEVTALADASDEPVEPHITVWTDFEAAAVSGALIASGPGNVWVALRSERVEIWLHRLSKVLDATEDAAPRE